MDIDYRTYTFDELARDEYFRKWVIERNAASDAFWSDWVARNPDCAGKVQVAKAFLLALEEKDTALAPTELDQLTDTVISQRETPVMPLWRTTAFRVAASVLLLLGIGYLGFRYQNRINDKPLAIIQEISPSLAENYTEVSNETAQNRRIVLEDNSQIVLYPASKLRYPVHFSGSIREVYLSGKAFFTITKNPRKPFWVYTNKISTQVLGTSFLVNAYPRKDDAGVQVRSGKVSVYTLKDVTQARRSTDRIRAGVVLTPNQQVAFSQTSERLIKSVVEQPVRLAVGQPKAFVFDEAPIGQVFALLEKTYGVTVVYDGPTMQNCFLTANLSEESLYDQLALICKITRSSYEMIDGQIIIHGQGCSAN